MKWTPWTIVHRNGTLTPVIPFDCNPKSRDEGMLVYRSERAAKLAAEHQSRLYGVKADAVPLADVIAKEAA